MCKNSEFKLNWRYKRCLLRKITGVIEIQTRRLENLEYEASSYGPFLIPVITKTLPQELNLLISRRLGSSERWEVEQVLKVLKTEISVHKKTFVFCVMKMRLLIKKIHLQRHLQLRDRLSYSVCFVKRSIKGKISVSLQKYKQVKSS